MEAKYHLIGRGFAGWHATGVENGNEVRSSGGNIDPYKYWAGQDCLGYRQEAIEGALVYDAAHLESDPVASKAFTHLVFAGPMFSPSLRPNEIVHFSIGAKRVDIVYDDRDITFGFEGAMVGSLDSVGVDIFKKLLKQVPGIKLGKIVKQEVIWE